jgi:phosphatidylserine synthase
MKIVFTGFELFGIALVLTTAIITRYDFEVQYGTTTGWILLALLLMAIVVVHNIRHPRIDQDSNDGSDG